MKPGRSASKTHLQRDIKGERREKKMQRVEEKQSEGDETQSAMGEQRKSEEVEMSPRIKEQMIIDEELNKPFEELDETREEKQESIVVQDKQNVQNDAT